MSEQTYEESATVFQHPFSCIIAGSSQCGKTVFIKNLLANLDTMISPTISEVIISYAEHQQTYSDMLSDPRVRLVKEEDDFECNGNGNFLIIIDDQMDSAMKAKHIQQLFTKGVHHRSISVILISQDLFPNEKYARTIRRNATYLIIFRSPTFRCQVQSLGGQLYPHAKKFLCAAYLQATELPYTYILVNFHPKCHDDLRVRSGVLPFENEFVFIPRIRDNK